MDDGVDRSSCNNTTSSISQSQFDAYQQLQRRATETLRVFTTQGVVSSGTARQNNRTVSRGGGGRTGGDANDTATANEYVTLDDMYAQEYNRDMDRRWANEPPLVFGDEEEEEEDGDQWSGGGEDDDIDEERRRDVGQRERRRLFGGSHDMDGEADDIDEPRSGHSSRDEGGESGGGGGGRQKRRQRMRSDDNPRQRKRHCPPRRVGGGENPAPNDDDDDPDEGDDDQDQPYDTQGRPECFLCAWGNQFHDGIEAPHVNKLTDIIHQNYGVHHNKEICNEVVLYYMQEVYDPALGMAPLSRQCVMEHLEHHVLDARIIIGEAIKVERKQAFLFLNKTWRADGTWDKAARAEYRASMRDICAYLRMDISKMNFNNGNSAEDMKKQANYMNLMMPRFDQKKPAAPRRNTGGAPRGGRAPNNNNNRNSPDRTSVPPSRKQFT